jgi:hypothetical protein
MPLRDHFRPPTTKSGSWEALHAMWTAVLVQHLRKQLPSGYVCVPRVRLGPYFEIDIGAFEQDNPTRGNSGGTATALAPPRPTWAVNTDVPEDDEYEVQIFNAEEERELVAVVELVSPANKDRPINRRAFVGKCSALLRKGVAVSIVDLVTIRHANLYAEMMAFIGHPDPTLGPEPSPIYASSSRWTANAEKTRARLESWTQPMTVGQPLPSLPIWLTDELRLAFDLDRSYEQACEDVSIA